MASAKATIDHDKIQKWVGARGGHPAHVKRTGSRRGDPGVLRIDYPGYSGEETLEEIDWDQWFDKFDRDKLAFLYQGGKSRFSKLVDRSTVDVERAPSPPKRRAGAAKTSARKTTKPIGDGARRSAKKAATKASNGDGR